MQTSARTIVLGLVLTVVVVVVLFLLLFLFLLFSCFTTFCVVLLIFST